MRLNVNSTKQVMCARPTEQNRHELEEVRGDRYDAIIPRVAIIELFLV